MKSNRTDHNQIEAQVAAHSFFRGLKAILREAVALGNATTRASCSPFNFTVGALFTNLSIASS